MTTDWKSPIEMARDLLAAKYLCLLCLGAIVVDFCHSLRFDYLLFKHHKPSNKIRWPQFCYFAVKLFYFPFWAVTFNAGEPSYQIDCQTTMLMSHVLMGIVTCLCSALLGFRTLCIWEQQSGKVLKYSLLLLWLALLAIWMAGSTDVKGSWKTGVGEAWIEHQGACWFDPIPPHYVAKFVATVAFDALVLVLTVAGVMKSTGQSRLGSILMEQGIIYFALTVIINVMVIAFTWSDMNDVMTVILSVPAQTISVMAATRLYVILYRETTKPSNSMVDVTYSLPLYSSPTKVGETTGSLSSFALCNTRSRTNTDKCVFNSIATQADVYQENMEIASTSLIGGVTGSSPVGPSSPLPDNVGSLPSSQQRQYDPAQKAKRPSTSPAMLERKAREGKGSFVFIHHSCSVVSEPLPVHLQGHPFMPS